MVNLDGVILKRKNSEMTSSMVATNSTSPPRSHSKTPADWLKTAVSPLPSRPSAELDTFFSLGSRSVANEVASRANIVLEAIFPSIESGERLVTWSLLNVNLMDSLWSGQERIEALKLYYKVLESICISEVEKLCSRDLSGLLTSEKFHRCTLACSAELVSVAHTGVSILFPLILERVGITAFDMSRVIESFIRHEESLPRELRQHLNSLEETMLESMVWEKGSSLYNSLIVTRPDLSHKIKLLKLIAEPMPSLDEIALNNHVTSGGMVQQQNLHKHKSVVGNDLCRLSDNKHLQLKKLVNFKLLGSQDGTKRLNDEYISKLVKLNSSASAVEDDTPATNCVQLKPPSLSPSLQTAFISPTQSKTPKEGGAHKDAAITVLFNKMAKLAAFRINSMAERMKLSKQIREKIYLLFQQILAEKTYLFFNRHIDLIMLCSFYGIAKISRLELTFKEITNNYIKEPQCRYQDFCFVFSSWFPQSNGKQKNGENYNNIIAFYNQEFILNVVSLVREIGSASAEASEEVPEVNNGICPKTPGPYTFPRIPDVSPKKVSPSQNVYLSPLRSSKQKDALNSHVGKSYYAFFGERTCGPTKDLDAINNRLNSNRKRRRVLNFDDVDESLISDSVVARSLVFGNDKSVDEVEG